MAREREELEGEIESQRAEWEQEKKAREAELKERDATEKKARDREREDFTYAFKRDQQAIKDKLNDEKAALEKEIKLKRETADKDLAEREKAIAERERELAELRSKAAAFPKELENAVNQAVKEISDKLKLEAKNREDLARKEFEGERNVLAAEERGAGKGRQGLDRRQHQIGAATRGRLSESPGHCRKDGGRHLPVEVAGGFAEAVDRAKPKDRGKA